MPGQDFQRTVSWTASASPIPISAYVVSCTSQEDAVRDLRTRQVGGSLTETTIGDGTGENAALAQGRTYTCAVYAINAAGEGSSSVSSSFQTYDIHT